MPAYQDGLDNTNEGGRGPVQSEAAANRQATTKVTTPDRITAPRAVCSGAPALVTSAASAPKPAAMSATTKSGRARSATHRKRPPRDGPELHPYMPTTSEHPG